MTIVVSSQADTDLLGSVIRLYEVVLGRQPDLGGLDYWYNQAQVNGGLAGIADGFIPAEFQFHSATDFLTYLYHGTLGRDPDASGLAYWQTQIADGMSYGKVAASFAQSAEFQNDVSAGVSAIITTVEAGGSPDPFAQIPGTPIFVPPVVHLPGSTTIVDVPVDVFVPTPTFETHQVSSVENGAVSLAGQDGAGHMLFGSGNSATVGYQVVEDHTANMELAMQPIYRTSATVVTPTNVIMDATGVTATFTMQAGAQDGSHGEQGANAARSGISLDFSVVGLNIGNNANNKVLLDVQGAAGFTAEYHLVVNATGQQAWENSANAIVIADNNNGVPNVVAAENSENFAFGIFGGTANFPAGTYTETLKIVGTSGLGNGQVFAHDTVIIHAT